MTRENHATREELNLAYTNFHRAIDKLSDVLDDHSRRLEKINDRLESRIKDIEQESKLSRIEFDKRISKLEEDKTVRETQKGVFLSLFKLAPKTFLATFFFVCAGVVHISDEIGFTEKAKAEHAITKN